MYIFLAIHVSKENNASIHHLPAIFAPTCLLFQKLQKYVGEALPIKYQICTKTYPDTFQFHSLLSDIV